LSEVLAASRGRWLLVVAAICLVGGLELYVTWLALHPNVTDNYRAYYIDQTTTCLDKPATGSYVLGQTISFLPDDQPGARKLRVCGWDGPAGDGTHSVGTRSMLRFAVAGPPGDLILRLQMTAIEARDRPQQRVLVSANGIKLGEATIPAGDTRSFDFAVPAAALGQGSGGALDVALDFPTAAQMVPNDSDTHYRSIKLLSVQLRRPGDAVSQGAQDDPRALRHHAGPDGPGS
jgi:hypothetical protein